MSNRFILIISILCCINGIAISQVTSQDSTYSDSLKMVGKEKLSTDNEVINNNEGTVQFTDTIIEAESVVEFDSTRVNTKKKGKPVVATLCSMAVPGLGQAYNRKYWKIPIIYSLFGTMYYFAMNNHQKYKDFKFAYKNFETDEKPLWVTENIKADYLKERMELYKRNRNFNIIIGVIVYLLNILDANVDAHLMDFDVGNDLSFRLEPNVDYIYSETNIPSSPNFGLKFVLTLNRN